MTSSDLQECARDFVRAYPDMNLHADAVLQAWQRWPEVGQISQGIKAERISDIASKGTRLGLTKRDVVLLTAADPRVVERPADGFFSWFFPGFQAMQQCGLTAQEHVQILINNPDFITRPAGEYAGELDLLLHLTSSAISPLEIGQALIKTGSELLPALQRIGRGGINRLNTAFSGPQSAQLWRAFLKTPEALIEQHLPAQFHQTPQNVAPKVKAPAVRKAKVAQVMSNYFHRVQTGQPLRLTYTPLLRLAYDYPNPSGRVSGGWKIRKKPAAKTAGASKSASPYWDASAELAMPPFYIKYGVAASRWVSTCRQAPALRGVSQEAFEQHLEAVESFFHGYPFDRRQYLAESISQMVAPGLQVCKLFNHLTERYGCSKERLFPFVMQRSHLCGLAPMDVDARLGQFAAPLRRLGVTPKDCEPLIGATPSFLARDAAVLSGRFGQLCELLKPYDVSPKTLLASVVRKFAILTTTPEKIRGYVEPVYQFLKQDNKATALYTQALLKRPELFMYSAEHVRDNIVLIRACYDEGYVAPTAVARQLGDNSTAWSLFSASALCSSPETLALRRVWARECHGGKVVNFFKTGLGEIRRDLAHLPAAKLPEAQMIAQELKQLSQQLGYQFGRARLV